MRRGLTALEITVKKQIILGALVAGALMFGAGAAAPAMAADSLLINGGFASPTLNASTSYNAGSSIPGWTVDTANGYDGARGLFIERSGTGGYQSADVLGSISQSFATQVGKTYTVSFAFYAGKSEINTVVKGNVPLAVSVTSGTQVNAQQSLTSPAAGGMDKPSFSFTASGTTTKISFTTPYMAVGIDEVSVTEVPLDDSPIMIPAIAGGLGVAALAAGSVHLLGRKNKRASA